MSDSKEKDAIIQQKEFLANEALRVANEAIGLLQDQMSECSTRDLVQIFTASVKAHREITEDIVILTKPEPVAEPKEPWRITDVFKNIACACRETHRTVKGYRARYL